MRFSPLMRQVIVALASHLSQISMGASLAFTGVLLQQIRAKGSTIQVDLDTLSWIASSHGIAGTGAVAMPSLMQKIGRKRAFILSCLLLLLGWILAFVATTANMIIFAEAFLGFGCNCVSIVNSITVSEMLAPKYRTIALTVLGLCQSFGIILITCISYFVDWKKLSLIMLGPVVIALFISLFWPESPPWLAYKENFSECEASFKWLRGSDEESLEELRAMITAQKRKKSGSSKYSFLKQVFFTFKMRDFNLPCLYMILVLVNTYLSGGICLFVYCNYVLQVAIGDEKIASTGHLIFDVNIVIGGVITLLLVKYTTGKVVLNIAYFRIPFLFLCSLVLYLQNSAVLSRSPVYFLSCFEGYVLFFCCGLNSVAFPLAVELIPVKHRGVGGGLFTILTGSLHTLTNKLLPYLMIWLELWGTLLFFAIFGSVCHILIWKYIPETKNKTLLEIEKSYEKKRHCNDAEVNMPMYNEHRY